MNSFISHQEDTLLLVDAHAIIYRAYFAFPQLTTDQGLLVNAAFGFTRILLSAIREMEPTYLAVLFDHPEETFRHQQFKEYKAHREAMPADLIPQIGITQKIVKVLGMPQFSLSGYEADDLIGTLSRQASEIEQKTIILTGDQDIFQLVNDWVHVYLPARGKKLAQEYDRQGVYQKIGVYPEQVIDLKALMGDSSDNIPGIKGIGPKTATKLIQEFGLLESVFQAVKTPQKYAHLLKGALLDKLKSGQESAFLSQKLAEIDQVAPIELDLEACRVTGYDKQQAVEYFQELGFSSLVNNLPNDKFETSVQESLF